MGNGSGLRIKHVGHSILKPASSKYQHNFLLKTLLRVPQITKNLIRVSEFSKDNGVFFEFRPHFCWVKDQATKEILLTGKLENGLYTFNFNKLQSITSPPFNHPVFRVIVFFLLLLCPIKIVCIFGIVG